MTNSLPTRLTNFLDQFPNDATCWSQATDEIMDLARRIRTMANEQLDLDIQAVDFRSQNTPSEWNTNYKNQITEVFPILPEWAKVDILENIYNHGQ